MSKSESQRKRTVGACTEQEADYVEDMPMTNVSVVEEALSLSPPERAALAKVLIESLEGDRRTDEEIKAELTSRLAELRSGEDPGLTFEEVFQRPS